MRRTVIFTDWVTARNASCEYDTQWERVGVEEGFVMIHKVARLFDILKVETKS